MILDKFSQLLENVRRRLFVAGVKLRAVFLRRRQKEALVNRNFSYLLTIVGIFCILIANSGIVIAASSPFSQTDWSGGSGQSAFTDNTKYDTGTNIKDSTAGEISIAPRTDWFNSSWLYRKKITFDNSAQAENLVDFPVLVKLTTSNTDYSKFKAAGADIRFTDSDGTTELDYEIESWNSSGDSFIWVKVPQIDASSNTDSIYMYYGNSEASDGQDVSNTWNANYAMVQHLEETADCPTTFTDSTSNDADGSCNGTPEADTGQIDGSRAFVNADAQFINVADKAAFHNSTMTVSMWANQSSLSTNKALISKWFYNTEGGWALQTGFNDETRLQLFIADSAGDFGDNNATTDAGSWTTGWHQVTFTYDGAGVENNDKLKVYIDGVAQDLTFLGTIAASLQDNATNLRIGEFGNLNRSWDGSLDEVRISTNVQSVAWIAASFKSESDTFNTFSSEEELQQYPTSASLTSSIFDTEDEVTWGDLTFSATTPTDTTVAVKVRTSDASDMSGATDFSTCDPVTSGSDISGNNCVADGQRYVQYQVNLTGDGSDTPTFSDISIDFTLPSPSPTPSPSQSSAPSSESVYHPPSSTEAPVCGLTAPSSAPGINRHVSGETSVDLFFSKIDGADSYVVSYGYDSKADNFGATFGGGSDSLIKQTVGALKRGTTYYFKVRGGNGCAAGPWSGAVKVTTTGGGLSFTPVVSSPKPKVASPSSSLIVKASPSPSPTPAAVVSISPAPSRAPLFQIPQPPKIDLSFFIPKFDFSFFGGIGQGLANLGNSVAIPIASLYKNLFEPKELMITEVRVSEKGDDFAVVTWKTNIPATSKVNYGDSYDYGKDFQSMEKVLEHKVVLTGLEKGKTYYYEVMSQSGGSYSFDARHEFTLE